MARSKRGVRRVSAAFAGVVALSSGSALASTGLDSPDNGTVQVGRGSAWLARADDPLAVYYNPATLARQASGVYVGAHLMFASQCFTRLDANGQPVSPGNGIPGPGAERGPKAEVCADGGLFPNPQLAATFRLSKDLAVGLAVLGPHGVGKHEWPESIPYDGAAGTQPAPQRYLLVSADATLIFPTFSVSYAPTETFSFGAGFVWGLALVEFQKFAEATSSTDPKGVDDFDKHIDIKATLTAEDLFIPGVVVGGLWSPSKAIDVAGWYKWQDALQASTADIYLLSNYWKAGGAKADFNADYETKDTGKGAGTSVRLQIPMEAKLGFRYHQPRIGGTRPAWMGGSNMGRPIRDALSQDLYDIELDVTWANNSAVDNLELRFKEGITVRGAAPGEVPVNADVPHQWRDVIGVRLGGDYALIPDFLALRAGAFFETKGQDDEYLNVDFHVGEKLGLSAGATVRLGPVDASIAYQHTFYGAIDNGGKGKLQALSGDKSTGNRTVQAVNGGRFESSLDEIALGATYRF
jgi:long-subunit fatty acid transport protein